MTLLKNNGILPLSKDIKTIAVVGPNADDRDVLFANYKGIASETVTLLDGIREAVPNAHIYYSLGCHISKTELRDDETSLLSEAVSCAISADAVIIATGINSKIEGIIRDGFNPEFGGGDRSDIELPGLQNKLIDLLYKTGKPLITVNMSGSAVNLCNADKKCDAILQAWYPGSLGGRAIASALFGDYSPSGKLPVTFYKSIDQLPPFDDYEMHDRTYRFFNDTPLYPFGYGLTYSDFEISCKSNGIEKIAAGKNFTININAKNNGSFDAKEIIQLYVSPPKNGSKNPNPELRAFKPIFVKVGSSKKISFTINPRTISLINDEGERVITPGKYLIYVGTGQPDERTYELTSKKSCIIEFEIVSNDIMILDY